MATVSELAWLARINAFADHDVAPLAGRWVCGDVPGKDLLGRAAEYGLTRIEVPVAEGGLGLSFAAKARACELLAAADFGFAMSVVNSHNVAAKLARCARPSVKDQLLRPLLAGEASACTALTEAGAGSDFAAIRTSARRVADGWVLNGEKTWIVNARHASVAIVYAQCGEIGSRDGIGAFVVDLNAQGVERFACDADFSQVSAGTGGFRLTDCHVEPERLLLEPGLAFKSILGEINGARIYVAAMCCGMVRAGLGIVRHYGLERHTFGQPLVDHQAWRLDLARCDTELAAAQALVAEAVAGIVAGCDVQLLAAQAKIYAVDSAQRQLAVLFHAMGAEALNPERPLARHLAAAQVAALVDGSTEMLLERVAHLTHGRARRKTQSDRQ